MSTVGQVVDAVFRDWLRPASDMPVAAPLAAAMDGTTTTLTFTTTGLLPDELDLFAIGTLVEVDLEQMLIVGVPSTGTLTVKRGLNGTSAVSHTTSQLAYPTPTFNRMTVFEAVCDAVANLWPDLYQVRTATVTAGSTYTEVPSWVQLVGEARWQEGGAWFTAAATLVRDFPSSSTKAAVFLPVTPGYTVYVTFRGAFERPATQADDLDLYGVKREWERAVAIEAAADCIGGGPELDPVTHEFVSEQLARETFPPGGPGQIAGRLRAAAEGLRMRHRRGLDAIHKVPVAFMPGSGV